MARKRKPKTIAKPTATVIADRPMRATRLELAHHLPLTGLAPRFLRSETGTGRSLVETEPLWWPPAKIVGRYLTPFLAEHLGLSQEYPRPERTDAVPVEVELDTREQAWSAV